jgi:hypothetical protein
MNIISEYLKTNPILKLKCPECGVFLSEQDCVPNDGHFFIGHRVLQRIMKRQYFSYNLVFEAGKYYLHYNSISTILPDNCLSIKDIVEMDSSILIPKIEKILLLK